MLTILVMFSFFDGAGSNDQWSAVAPATTTWTAASQTTTAWTAVSQTTTNWTPDDY